MKKNASITQYQFGFSDIHYREVRDSHRRSQKAKKIARVLCSYYKYDTEFKKVLDIGSSTWFITKELSRHFLNVTGIDIDEKAIKFAKKKNSNINIRYLKQDCQDLKNFKDNSFDAIVCAHIYEHVYSPEKMMSEIYRVLKKDGVCYFAAGNKFRLVEGHYNILFLSLVPKFLSNWIVKRYFGREYFENHMFYWQLKRLVNKFKVTDYTKKIIACPEKYFAQEMLSRGTIKQEMALKLSSMLYCVIPTYIWLLKK